MNFQKLPLIEKIKAETSKNNPEQSFWKQFRNPVLLKEHAAIHSITFQQTKPFNFALTTSTRVQVYDSKSLTAKKTISRFNDVVHSCDIRKDGKLLVASDASGLIQLFDMSSRAILRTLKGHRDGVRMVKFIDNNASIMSGSDDKTVKIWDIATETSLNTFEDHQDYVRAGAINLNNSNIIVTGSYDHTVKVWDIRANSCVLTMQHQLPVESVLSFPNGALIASAGGNQVKIWDVISGGKLLHTISNHQKTITSMTFNSNSTRILTGSLDAHVRIYNIEDFKIVHSIKYPAPILSVGVSNDDTTLAVGMSNGTLAVRKRVVRTQDIQIEKEIARNGTTRYYNRGGDAKPQDSDIIIESQRVVKLTRYEKFLKAFAYQKALDCVLTTNQNPVIVVSLINELIHRDGLRIALSARDDVGLEAIARFALKYAMHPEYTPTLFHVINMILEIYGNVIGQSLLCEQVFMKIKEKIIAEISTQTKVLETLGMLETICSARMAIEQ